MKILVIGGNRFFGRRLVEQLIAAGDEVTLLNRGQLADPFGGNVERIRCDRRDEAALAAAMRATAWDAVVDQVCYDAVEARAAVRVFGSNTSLYVFTSTNSVYTRRAVDLPESAYDPRQHAFTTVADSATEYGEAKRQAEAVFFRESEMRVIAPRFPFVCGPDDYSGRLDFHITRVRDGLPIYVPNVEARLTFMHSQDAAASLSFLLKEAPPSFRGAVNCASPDAISMRELVQWIEESVGRKALLATDETDENRSPYGAAVDSFTSTTLLKSLGFEARPIREWMPQLIAERAAKL